MKNKRLIGFSAGFLWHTYQCSSKAIIKKCKDMGCNAIELHCPVEEFHLIDELKPDDFKGFDFVSLHSPSGIENSDILDKLQGFHNKLKFDAIVVHADQVKDWDKLKSYDMPFSIENMDQERKTGKTLESMKKIMSHSDYRVVLDINHAYTNDPTLKLAEDLWNEFKNRISHFHLSGYEKKHSPLVETQQTELIDFLKNKDKLIIIESVCEDLDQAQKEFNFVLNHLGDTIE